MERKTERLSVMVLKEHKKALRRIAAVDGEAMAVIIRWLIREEACKRGVWRPENDA